MNARAAILLATGLVALSACGGAGNTASSLPLPAAKGSVGAPDATAKLVIHYPAVHHINSGARAPKFVDPNGTQLQILEYSYAFSQFTPYEYVNVAPGSDGTQTVTFPIVSSTSSTFIQITELGTAPALLSQGSGYFGSVAPGRTLTGTLTLNMNVYDLAVTTDPSTFSPSSTFGTLPTNSASVPKWAASCTTTVSYIYPVDALLNAAITAPVGIGGIPPVTLVSQTPDNGGSTVLTTKPGGGYQPVFDTLSHGVTATFSAGGLTKSLDFIPASC